MGGSSGGGVPATEAQATPAQPQVPVADFAAFSPGQEGLLAQQMQQGFGGSLLDHQGAMGFYRDMQAPVINEPGDIANYLAMRGLTPETGGTPATPNRDPVTGQVIASPSTAAATPAGAGNTSPNWYMGSNR